MTDPIQNISKDVQEINQGLGDINKGLGEAIKNKDTVKTKEIREQVKLIKQTLRDFKKAQIATLPTKEDTGSTPTEDYSLTKMWGDQRYNPYWLKLAEYFGIKEKEYPMAQSKISEILDWAANNAKSRKMSDILYTVGKTIKKLSSPGYSERAYAVLHRYIRLSNEKKNLSPEQQRDVGREMQAYEK